MLFGYMVWDKESDGKYNGKFKFARIEADLNEKIDELFLSQFISHRASKEWVERQIEGLETIEVDSQIYQFFNGLNEPAIILQADHHDHLWYVWTGIELFSDARGYREDQGLRKWEKLNGKPERKPFLTIKDYQLNLK